MPRPELLSAKAGMIRKAIDPKVSTQLAEFARNRGMTPFMVMFAIIRALHYRVTLAEDATIGTAVANRSRPEVEGLIGFFVNMLAIRLSIQPTITFNQLCDETKQAMTSAFANQDVPFERIVQEVHPIRDLSRNPVVQLALVLQDDLSSGRSFQGLETERIDLEPTTRLDMEFHVKLSQSGSQIELWYSRDLYTEDTARHLVSAWLDILQGALEVPHSGIGTIPFRNAITQLEDIGVYGEGLGEYPSEKGLAELFGAFAKEYAQEKPDFPAVKDAMESMTYVEFDKASDSIALNLISFGLPAETQVGVYADRSCRYAAAIVGIIKAGMAYTPIDPSLPRERIHLILSDMPTCPTVLCSAETHAQNVLHGLDLKLRKIDDLIEIRPDHSHSLKMHSSHGRSLAYVMYTSGSTGKPKGVMIEHRAVSRLILNPQFNSPPYRTVWSHICNTGFDFSTLEFWGPLLTGGTLVCFDKNTVLDIKLFAKRMKQFNVKKAGIPPAMVKSILDEDPDFLSQFENILIGGDVLQALDAQNVARLMGGTVYNGYGPTEACCLTTVFPIPPEKPCFPNVPIGRTLQKSSVYLLDDAKQLVPPGVVGELYVGGHGLARGYTDPVRSAASFITVSIDGTPQRLYKSGDATRWRPNNRQLEFVGRLDNQVKLRGQRLELGEIEIALRRDARIGDAAAVLQTDPRSEQVIVAFIVLKEADNKVDENEVRVYLKRMLPSYMVPSVVHTLPSFPATPSGKTDRRMLSQAPEYWVVDKALSSVDYVAPRNPSEEAIIAVFEEVLLRTGISVHSAFFDVGGHSLLATQAVSRINRALESRITIQDLFKYPTAAGLSSLAERTKEEEGQKPAMVISKCAHGKDSAPSYAQERMWFLDQFSSDQSWYLTPLALRLHGSVNIQALDQALTDLQERHEAFRTIFVEKDGQPRQKILSSVKSLIVEDWREDSKSEEQIVVELDREASSGFDLSKEAGYRAKLFILAQNNFVLSIVIHHISFDGWSWGVFKKELEATYEARCQSKTPDLPPLAIQYRDFSEWQRQPEQQFEHERQLSYWLNQLRGARPAEFPTDFARPEVLSSHAKQVPVNFSEGIAHKIDRLTRLYGATPFMFFLAAFRALHYRVTAYDDVTIGTTIANRNYQELEGLIGFFVNTQAYRIPMEEDTTFDQLLASTRDATTEAYNNQDIAFERIVRELQPVRDRSRNPVIQLYIDVVADNFDFENPLHGLEVETLETKTSTRFDAEMHLFKQTKGYGGTFIYSTDLYTETTARQLVRLFQALVNQALDRPSVEVTSLEFPGAAAELDQFGLLTTVVTEYPRDKDIPTVFREVASKYPDNVAVKDQNSSLTYRELDLVSDNIALHLAGIGLPSEAAVPVYTSRSCGYVASLIGVLKAGLAYLPLDLKLPKQRILTILEDIKTPLVVLHDEQADLEKLSEVSPKFFTISSLFSPPKEPVLKGQMHQTHSRSLAYRMYTSGSTGKPKGVMVEHRGILRLSIGHKMLTGSPGQRWAHVGNTSFDISTGEIYPAILNGGTVVCIDHETVLDLSLLAQCFEAERIDVAMITPALLHRCLQQEPHMFRNLEIVGLGGDILDVKDAKLLTALVKGHVVNALGHTENTTHSTSYQLTQGDDYARVVPVGKAWSNSTAFVLDSQQNLVPPSVIGTIHLGGDGLARGYTDPEKTKASFVEITVQDKTHRVYNTGDRGRWRSTDGELEFLGRKDYQVKVRGHRIELGEIEFALTSHPQVIEAVVLIQSDQDDDKHIIAFIVGGQEGAPHPAELKTFVSKSLPTYMVPEAIEILPQLPVTVTGKVDRKLLQASAEKSLARLGNQEVDYVHPRNSTEKLIADAFAEVLGRENVGVFHNFFSMGGHSLLATKVISRLRVLLKTRISVRELFDNPTPAGLAATLGAIVVASSTEGATETEATTITKSPPKEYAPASFGQERLWFLDQLSHDKSWYLVPLTLQIQGMLDIAALNSSINFLRQRHDILRTIFIERDGRPLQKVLPFSPEDIAVTNLENDPNAQKVLDNEIQRINVQPFRLNSEPSIRVHIFRLGPQEHVLSVIMHHIISDGWSIGVLQREVAGAYDAYRNGKTPNFPELPIQYLDYAAWQRDPEQEHEHRRQLSYWVEQLRGNVPAQIPTDFARPAILSPKAGIEELNVDRRTTTMLHAFCAKYHFTPFVAILAAIRALHFRMTAEEDAVFGSPIANRNRQDLEGLIGFFVNTQAMRIQANGSVNFLELAYHVKDVATAAFSAPDVAFEWIVRELQPFRDSSRNPIVQIMIAVQPEESDFNLFGDANVELVDPTPTTRFDAELHFTPKDNCIQGHFVYSSDLFLPETARNFGNLFSGLLSQVLHHPDLELDDILWPTAPNALDKLNRLDPRPAKPYDKDLSLGEHFSATAASHPNEIAAEDMNEAITYEQLDQRSDTIAMSLIKLGLAPESVVAVYADRSVPYIVSILGIVKAGMAYLPLDPNVPSARLHTILSDVPNKIVVIAQKTLDMSKFDGIDTHIFDVATFMVDSGRKSTELYSTRRANGRSLAYIMYTSGSTGKPKGVMIEHHSIARMAMSNDVAHARPKERWCHSSNPAFDFSTWEIWAPILNGATVVCIDRMMFLDVPLFARFFLNNQLKVAGMTPSVVRNIIAEAPEMLAGFETLCLGGEVVYPHDIPNLIKLMPNGKCLNGWGPTEACVLASTYDITATKTNPPSVPIGSPLSGVGIHILDRQGRLCPPGIIGEAFLSGEGVARGYTDPERTKQSFVTIELEGRKTRMYRTGDLVRWRPSDGQLEFFGRADQQVKLRGQRIELGEIEDRLRNHPKVSNSAVVMQTNQKQDQYLVAFVVAADQHKSQVMSNEDKIAARQQVLEDTVYSQFASIPPAEMGKSFTGWNDPLTDDPIPESEMQEWLRDLLHTIHERPLGNVVELMPGSGLVLFNLDDSVKNYVALEPSNYNAQNLEKSLAYRTKSGTWNRNVEIRKGPLSNLSQVQGDLLPDTLILNSVVQYFPNTSYFETVLTDCIKLANKRPMRVLVTDVKSLALDKHFRAYSAVDRLSADLPSPTFTRGDVRQRMQHLKETNTELLVDPSFFFEIKEKHLEITHIEIRPKFMSPTNLLSQYRYEAILWINHENLKILDERRFYWYDYEQLNFTQSDLVALLRRSNILAIENIPNRKLNYESELLSAMEYTSEEDWLIAAIFRAADKPSTISASGLLKLAKRMGFRVDVSWARQNLNGNFDVVFSHLPKNTRIAFKNTMIGPPTNQPANIGARGVDPKELQSYLAGLLPSYMVPSFFSIQNELPLQSTGKVDRKLLMSTTFSIAAVEDQVEEIGPRNQAEEQVLSVFEEVLEIERLSVLDSFFDVGGHSLLATKVISRIRHKIGVPLTVRHVFDAPTPAGLAQIIVKYQHSHPKTEIQRISRTEHRELSEASFAQERLWFIDELSPGSSWYLILSGIHLKAKINCDALDQALLDLTARHETLRTNFVTDEDGRPLQRLRSLPKGILRYIDLRFHSDPQNESEAILAREKFRGFELREDLLFRVFLIQVGDDEHILFVVMHHIISDGWSLGVFNKELAMFYEARCKGETASPPELPIQYKDFAAWQRTPEQLEQHQQQLTYWVDQLRTHRPAEFPEDYSRPEALSGRAGNATGAIDSATAKRIINYTKRRGATPFIFFLSVLRTLHYRMTLADDSTFGVPIANRNHHEVEGLIGFFVNMLPIRLAVEKDMTFDDLCEVTRNTCTAAFSNQDVPFERIVKELQPARDTSRNPLAQVGFSFHDTSFRAKFAGFEGEELDFADSIRMDLEIHMIPQDEGYQTAVAFSRDLFSQQTGEALMKHFNELVSQVLANPLLPLGKFSFPSEEIGEIGLAMTNENTLFPSLSAGFQTIARRNPDKEAIVDSNTSMTYVEVDTLSDKVARHLLSLSLPPESRIMTFFYRSCSFVVATIGILKAGMAYVPVDPSLPEARVQMMLDENEGQKIILFSENVNMDAFQNLGATMISIESLLYSEELNGPLVIPPSHIPGPHSLAYIIYTSGSTGKPKGVMVEHEGIARWQLIAETFTPPAIGLRWAHIANLAFDASVLEIWTGLLSGGTIVVIDHDTVLDPQAMAQAFKDLNIQTLLFTPAILNIFVESFPEILKQLEVAYVGADVCPPAAALKAAQSIKGFYNMYGPSEGSVGVCRYLVPKDHPCYPVVPIGRPYPETDLLVLDESLNLCPPGIIGELYIGGRSVARGYTDRGRTASAFFNITINGISHRVFKSGDGVRWRNGEIEYMCRLDTQFKIRGQRAESGEIESVLRFQPAVLDAAVVIQYDSKGDAFVVAFVTSRGSSSLDPTRLRVDVGKKLPKYMVPTAIQELPTLPLTTSGKVDRKRLATDAEFQVVGLGGDISQFVSPRNVIEDSIVQAYQDVLKLDRVGIKDSFFDVGGDSLMATKAVSRIKTLMPSAKVTVRDLFSNATPEALAAKISLPSIESLNEILESSMFSGEEVAKVNKNEEETLCNKLGTNGENLRERIISLKNKTSLSPDFVPTVSQISNTKSLQDLSKVLFASLRRQLRQTVFPTDCLTAFKTVSPDPTSGVPKPRVYMIHDGFGTPTPFKSVAPHLDMNVYAITDPYYGEDQVKRPETDKSFDTIQEMASAYLERIEANEKELLASKEDEPITLLGWCYGAMVASEMAYQLSQRGKKSRMVLVDPYYLAEFDKGDGTTPSTTIEKSGTPAELMPLVPPGMSAEEAVAYHLNELGLPEPLGEMTGVEALKSKRLTEMYDLPGKFDPVTTRIGIIAAREGVFEFEEMPVLPASLTEEKWEKEPEGRWKAWIEALVKPEDRNLMVRRVQGIDDHHFNIFDSKHSDKMCGFIEEVVGERF